MNELIAILEVGEYVENIKTIPVWNVWSGILGKYDINKNAIIDYIKQNHSNITFYLFVYETFVLFIQYL